MKSALCMHWPGVLSGEWYRAITTFTCLGGAGIEMRGILHCCVLYESVAPFEAVMRAQSRGTFFVSQLVFGAIVLLGLQYYGNYLHYYQLLGESFSFLLYRPSRWMSYDLGFFMTCAMSWERPADPVMLSLGLPMMLKRWQLPFVLSGIHALLSDGQFYVEALAASLLVRGGLAGMRAAQRLLSIEAWL
eukprot:TRINITY_DN3672_c0_g1_i2.p2 TRINITY_DN3672_c0_g1~~TRINITY_DN3672_c0_g1_i2.p2  ORF type:complete len:189 (-),score=35.61 TRINITY_DN3672_c0_g1_i2:305-871(-)